MHTQEEVFKLFKTKLFSGSLERDLVFARPDGRPLNPGVVSHSFFKTPTRAGLPHVRFHDLRHTRRPLLLKSGIHPKIVSKRLAHAGIGITLDTYSHVVLELQEKAAKCFDEIPESKLAVEDACKRKAATSKCQRSSEVEQRFRKPSVVGSNPTAGSGAFCPSCLVVLMRGEH